MSTPPSSKDAPGLALAEAYAREVIGPLLDEVAPDVPIGLARLGSGSDVLGLDDDVSRDHDWGLRLTVVVPEAEIDRIDAFLEERLPEAFRGHPTRFATTWDAGVRQRAEVVSALGFARSRTGLDLARPLDTLEWLSLTGQGALEITAGPVWRDDDGALARIRSTLAGYPDDVRLFAIASAWQRIEQELPFVGRTAARGDDVGSRVIAARLVATAMHLGFLLERRWAPYAKWLGTAFARLPRVGALAAPLSTALAAASGADREAALVTALDGLAEVQGELGLPTLVPATERFWARDVRGLRPIAAEVQRAITDPSIRDLPLLGTPELWSDSVDLLVRHDVRIRAVGALYGVA